MRRGRADGEHNYMHNIGLYRPPLHYFLICQIVFNLIKEKQSMRQVDIPLFNTKNLYVDESHE